MPRGQSPLSFSTHPRSRQPVALGVRFEMPMVHATAGQNPAIKVARWLAVLPGAVAAGWAAWVAISLVNRLTFSWQGLDPDSFFSRLYIEGVSHGMLGAVSVYVGSKIAPVQKAATVFVLAFLFVLGVGVLLFPAIGTRNWWAVYGAVALALGAGSTCWSVYLGETDVN